MKIKVNDHVKVIAGSYKGKEGKVLRTFKKEDRILVEGINMVKKHMKPNAKNETGGILERENPIHVSNVKLVKESKTVKTSKTVKKVETKKKTNKKSSGDVNE